MRILLLLIVLSLIYSCSNPDKKFRGTEGLRPQELVTDTIVFVDPQALNSNSEKKTFDIRETIVAQFPLNTKIVEWYSIGYMPDGSGLLTVTTEDGVSRPPIPLPNSTSVAATATLLQNAYVRIGADNQIFSYKSANPALIPVKSF